ncbi:disulfide bond formation protein B [Thauera sinica]|uniref:Disulfide bond formation protein B n=1 Tax=Thauera sinica TaxID=2665146 RepID=A0ABW1AXY4_9RHOO|nr:disulfide bond formation protein B [Thauera sp. K11]ATE60962.1 disulfide bond formation protein B [Thauera sp. K11]
MSLLQQICRLPARTLFFALFAICVGLLGGGLYLQHVVGLQPCPMCIMQRYAFVAVALIALIAALHGPAATGARVYALLTGITALAGAGVAARQSWMQLNPPEIPECGPGLEYLLESFPLGQSLPMIFRGAGDCATIDWTFLGLSLANWSLLCFCAVIAFSAWLALRRSGG